METLYDIGEQDLKELMWGHDFDSPMNDAFGSDQDWSNLLDHQPVILNDRMITDAVQSPRIQSEHSYSLSASDDLPGSPLGMHDKYKLEDFGKDLDESDCFPAIPMNSASSSGASGGGVNGGLHNGNCSGVGVGNDSSSSSSSSMSGSPCPSSGMHIKQEPLSEPCSPQPMLCSSPFSELRRNHHHSHSHHHHGHHQSHHNHHHQTSLHSHHYGFMHRSSDGSLSGSDSNSMDGMSGGFTSGLMGSSVTGSSSSSGAGTAATMLKQPTIVLATEQSKTASGRAARQSMLPKVKVETGHSSAGFSLPPTPPSSNSSDSEGSLSPVYLQPPSSPPPPGLLSCPSASSASRKAQRMLSAGSSSSSSGLYTISSKNSNSQLISSQPKGATGLLMLTEEEKRTLLAEGYPIPTRLPLTKAEEKSLKKIRRKIKNKISAQESRRKKKEYMDALEKKVENLASENNEYKRRMDSLENNNKSLLTQLHKLQGMMGDSSTPSKMSRTVYTQTSTPFTPKRASVKLGKS